MVSFLDNLDPNSNPFAQIDQPLPQAMPGPPPMAPQAMPPQADVAAPAMPPAAPQGLLDPPAAPAPAAAAPAQPGFLQRLMAPSPSGLTFADKLMAAGSIMKGDSAGAQKYLQNRYKDIATQQEQAQKNKDTAEKLAAARQGAKDLADSTNADGTVNLQQYFKLRAAAGQTPDDKMVAAIYAHNIPKNVAMSGPEGMVNLIRENPPDGQAPTATQVVKPQPKIAPTPYGYDATTQQPTAAYLKGVTALAAAQRAGKPLAPRAAPRGPKRSSFDPTEVH